MHQFFAWTFFRQTFTPLNFVATIFSWFISPLFSLKSANNFTGQKSSGGTKKCREGKKSREKCRKNISRGKCTCKCALWLSIVFATTNSLCNVPKILIFYYFVRIIYLLYIFLPINVIINFYHRLILKLNNKNRF